MKREKLLASKLVFKKETISRLEQMTVHGGKLPIAAIVDYSYNCSFLGLSCPLAECTL